MFPIPSGRKLSFIDTGKYSSRDRSSFASSEELRITLSKAWWRGELVAENGPSRLNVLRANISDLPGLYRVYHSRQYVDARF
jgi:hypothetical protein